MNNQELIVGQFRIPQVFVAFGLTCISSLIEGTVKALLEGEHFQWFIANCCEHISYISYLRSAFLLPVTFCHHSSLAAFVTAVSF